MKKYSRKATEFIEREILPQMNEKIISEDNIEEIIDFIIDHYEVPLSQAKEAGEKIDDELLDLVSSIVTEVTTDPDW